MIGSRERIVLVEIGDTWLVVGLVPGQIRTLHTLPKGELQPAGDGERPFAQWLKQIAERKNEGR
jgi:flagellar protein FliO/FliZ